MREGPPGHNAARRAPGGLIPEFLEGPRDIRSSMRLALGRIVAVTIGKVGVLLCRSRAGRVDSPQARLTVGQALHFFSDNAGFHPFR